MLYIIFVILICKINNILASLFPNKFDEKDCPGFDEYKETIKWGEWCKQTIGCMYGHYDYMSYCGPEDGRWFGCRTEEEVQTVTGISYAMAFKNPEDLLLFKLTFGIP